jgi:DNA-binding SARP family transcriptional activator
MRAECQEQNPLPLLQEAYALARGEFFEDDVYCEWVQNRRRTINGARHRVLFKLVDLYLKDERVGLAEELLFAMLEEDPADEDALCRLMILLVEQGRRQEALQIYQYSEDILQEEQTEAAVYTRELAHRIQQGLTLREQGESYTAVDGTDRKMLFGPCMEKPRLSIQFVSYRSRPRGLSYGLTARTSAPGLGSDRPPRHRSRRQATPPVG